MTSSKKGFVLARYWKVQWKEAAESFSVSPAFIQELSAFRNPNDIIGLFSKYGTHFLSGYSIGDCIYQVFVYDEQVYNGVLQQFPQNPNHLFGYNGVLFRLFTKPRYMHGSTL